MFAVMPLGGGLGAFLGGLFYDVRGTYDIAQWSNVVLLSVVTVLVVLIRGACPPRTSRPWPTSAPPEAAIPPNFLLWHNHGARKQACNRCESSGYPI